MKKSREDEMNVAPEAAISSRGTTESLADPDSGLRGDVSSLGSDSEINGFVNGDQKIDKYGFVGGAQYTDELQPEIPPEVLRQRESKWLDMLNNWDKWMAKKHKKVKLRCQKGIPPSLRGRAWQYLSGSKVKMEQNHGKFDVIDQSPGDPTWLDVIERDLHRQFPFHEMFIARGGHGQQDLYRILKAYTIYRPEEGYCQAQAPIAAVLLMHMPAEQAFWCLVQICEKYLPGYYSAGLEAVQLDGEIFFALLRKVSPVAYKHLNKHKIDPILYMTEWFMCAFSRTLPWASVLRIWDMFFCEGVKVIFRVGLILLKYTLGSSDKLKKCQGQYETMEKLRSIDLRYMQEVFLVREVIDLPVTEREIEKEHLIQLKKWKDTHGDLKCHPPPRLHGAKAINEAEPHSHKALVQTPSIVIQSPPVSPSSDSSSNSKKKDKKSTKEQKKEKKKLEKKMGKTESVANGSAPDETKRILKDEQHGAQQVDIAEEIKQSMLKKDSQLQQSEQSLSSEGTEQDTYL
ncbi:TBC1 domain family member 10A [Hemitrygon akajei]|uniref:TBC1 domain family member 10A n=1 Tax=Hemitrygon akajei TaxID=2704970 RepID=UPI003BF9AA45